jgi:hypothetical protein
VPKPRQPRCQSVLWGEIAERQVLVRRDIKVEIREMLKIACVGPQITRKPATAIPSRAERSNSGDILDPAFCRDAESVGSVSSVG